MNYVKKQNILYTKKYVSVEKSINEYNKLLKNIK